MEKEEERGIGDRGRRNEKEGKGRTERGRRGEHVGGEREREERISVLWMGVWYA